MSVPPIPNLTFQGGNAGPAVSGAPTYFGSLNINKNMLGVWGFLAIGFIGVLYIVGKKIK